MMKNSWLNSIAFLISLYCNYAISAEFVYPAVDPNIPNGILQQLPYRASDQKIPYGEDPLQFGELWLPDNTAQRGLVILVHGGCWSNLYRLDYMRAAGTALSQLGYAVWSVEYRSTGDDGGGWPGTYDDVVTAINFSKNLSQYGVTSDSISLVGHSAGGHLVALVGTERNALEVTLDRVISLAGINRVPDYAEDTSAQPGGLMELCQNLLTDFVGVSMEEDSQIYDTIDPSNKELHPSTFLFVAELDEVVPVTQGEITGAQKILIDGAGHSDFAHPGTPAFARLADILLD